MYLKKTGTAEISAVSVFLDRLPARLHGTQL